MRRPAALPIIVTALQSMTSSSPASRDTTTTTTTTRSSSSSSSSDDASTDPAEQLELGIAGTPLVGKLMRRPAALPIIVTALQSMTSSSPASRDTTTTTTSSSSSSTSSSSMAGLVPSDLDSTGDRTCEGPHLTMRHAVLSVTVSAPIALCARDVQLPARDVMLDALAVLGVAPSDITDAQSGPVVIKQLLWSVRRKDSLITVVSQDGRVWLYAIKVIAQPASVVSTVSGEGGDDPHVAASAPAATASSSSSKVNTAGVKYVATVKLEKAFSIRHASLVASAKKLQQQHPHDRPSAAQQDSDEAGIGAGAGVKLRWSVMTAVPYNRRLVWLLAVGCDDGVIRVVTADGTTRTEHVTGNSTVSALAMRPETEEMAFGTEAGWGFVR